MYSLIELHDGTSTNIRTSDITRLGQVLGNISTKFSQLGKVTPQTNLENLTLSAGMAVVQLFSEEQLPMTTEIGFCDGQVHPIRSLGYSCLGGFYAGIESVTASQKTTFQSTQKYFRDVFLVQEAITLEETRDKPNQEYLIKLNQVLERLAKDYNGEITRQTKAFKELAVWLSNPSRN